MENRRLTAKIASINEIINGKFIKKEGFESSYILTSLGRRISRARILGLVVDKFTSDDNNYGTITIDDGTETIRCKLFVNLALFATVNPGDLVDVIGKLREYNGEIYLVPEIVRKKHPNFESLRLLELKKILDEQTKKISTIQELKKVAADATELKILAERKGLPKEDVESILEAEELIRSAIESKVAQTTELKEKILQAIQELDQGEGAEYTDIIQKTGLPESTIDEIIESLLTEGICIEPKAGKIKKL